MTYAVIAFKSSSCETIHGCVTDSYSEDLQIVTSLSEQEMVRVWAGFMATPLRNQEDGYTVSILVDSALANDAYCDDLSRWQELAEAEAGKIVENRKAALKLEAERLAESAKKRKAEITAKAEAAELAELARLKKKYEGR
jgi:hypothetical protein